MEWEIVSFEGMGPIRFGMSPAEVAAIIGPPESADEDDGSRREYRAIDVPIVSYEDNVVTEIEAFYEVENVSFRGRRIFDEPGLAIIQFLEQENGGARMNVGTVLFRKIGITSGCIDQRTRGDHSITAFAQGLWDDRLDRFKELTFL
ncbi:hypothetical protein EDE05_106238 [Neorhizobium sp. R1-B]|uniref:hypothetical protein n=1 Tax=Neorhizobium sp. R1-B TaxID=2485162 RepID=UPI0010651C47|nr:hypothetical protein [Neorhizobium sp. R1-B]TDX83829.1 hypothetical protein EDE05_106238 [Neorhizobium sp. R1-B]